MSNVDYKRLVELLNTLIADRNQSKTTSDSAKAVATLTGFIGVEALLAEKPVIVFELHGIANASSLS